MLTDGLFDGMNVVTGELLQALRSLCWRETAIGVDTQLYLVLRKRFTDMTHEGELMTEVDGSDLQLYAAKSVAHLGLKTLKHLIEASHPHQSVDGDAFLAACERRVEEHALASVLEVEQGRLKTEEHGGVRAEHICGHTSHRLHHTTQRTQGALIVGAGVATEVGERGTLSHSAHAGTLRIGDGEKP